MKLSRCCGSYHRSWSLSRSARFCGLLSELKVGALISRVRSADEEYLDILLDCSRTQGVTSIDPEVCGEEFKNLSGVESNRGTKATIHKKDRENNHGALGEYICEGSSAMRAFSHLVLLTRRLGEG